MGNLPNWVDFIPFRPIFREICNHLGFDFNLEIQVRDFFRHQLKTKRIDGLISEIGNFARNRIICFCGAGPNLDDHIQKMHDQWINHRDSFYIVAADGSANALALFDIIPDLVISDFDGLTPQQMCNLLDQNIILVVLAHGDNYQNLSSYSSIFKKYSRIIGTTQASARYPIINPGGFTDGDRGIFLLHHLLPLQKSFFLFGYEFKSKIGKYSKPYFDNNMPITPIKHQKLQICEFLLSLIQSRWNRTLFDYSHDLLIIKERWNKILDN
ncbi:6-hydroxymethylpterin diphosphokinase MptE-like protein [Candidatus Harpocratesius sp.]